MTDNNMKMCIDCKMLKQEDLKNFPLNRKRPDGSLILRTRCKQCYKEHRRAYDKKNLMRKQEVRHKYYLKHKETIKHRSQNRYYRLKKEDEMNLLREFYVKEQEKIEETYNIERK